MNKSLSILAVVLASGALVTALLNRGDRPGSASIAMTNHSAEALASQVENMRMDFAALKDSTRELLDKVARLERAKAPAAVGAPDLARFQQRLDALDAKQTQLAQMTRDIDKHGVISGLEKEVVKAYSTLMDTNLPIGLRLKQAETLKRNGQFDERAVKAMTAIYGQSSNFTEKAIALNALSGAPNPDLRDQILSDLNTVVAAGYTDPRFRYTAIEALEPMAQDANVQQWLNHLAQNDPEPKLAARAGSALGLSPPPAAKK